MEHKDFVDPRKLFKTTLREYNEETGRTKHVWLEPEANLFKVRGGTYMEDSIKIRRQENQYTLIGMDLILHDPYRPLNKIAEQPYLAFAKARKLGFKGFVFILNFKTSLGNFVGYWTPTRNVEPDVPETCTMKPYETGHKTFDSLMCRFIEGTDEFRNDRLKIIPSVVSGNWMIRQAVNGKPALICNKIDTVWHQCLDRNYLEGDIDVSSSTVACSILSIIKMYISSVAIDLAFTIEGRHLTELPEEIVCGLRFISVDPSIIPSTDLLVEQYLAENCGDKDAISAISLHHSPDSTQSAPSAGLKTRSVSTKISKKKKKKEKERPKSASDSGRSYAKV